MTLAKNAEKTPSTKIPRRVFSVLAPDPIGSPGFFKYFQRQFQEKLDLENNIHKTEKKV